MEGILKNNFPFISPAYREFALEKNKCKCCDIYEHYEQNAQSEGNAQNPTFMFVGEAYGREEQQKVRPFIGRAGQRLRLELRKWPKVFSKKTTILTNILSCRPLDNKFPEGGFCGCGDRDDQEWTDDLGKYCMDLWLKREIQLLRPKVIVALGAVALRYLFDLQTEKPRIGEHRGEWRFLSEYQAMGFATYHPSYVLRCSNDPKKSYGAKLFEQDIEKIATSWERAVSSEKNMFIDKCDLEDHTSAEKLQSVFVSAGIGCQGVTDD